MDDATIAAVKEWNRQDALAAAILAINEQPGDDDRTELCKAKARAQMVGYDAKYRDAGYVASEVEREFNLPIVNPHTGQSSRNFQQAGKLDVQLLTPTGERATMDHKTSSMDIEDPSSAYWRQLQVDSQVSMYALACWQEGEKVDCSVWDVIRKPTIRPARVAKAVQKEPDRLGTIGEITALGTYYGVPVTDYDRGQIAADGRETVHLYEARLRHDCLDRPSHYFQRRKVPRLDDEMLLWAEELWVIAKDIRDTQRRAAKCEKFETAWFRNSGACMNYGTPCEYLGLCSGVEVPDNGMWTIREKPHEELTVDSDNSRWSILSHSSIRTYQTCRRKAYYRYELRLQRIDEDEREATFYGTLMHKALEAWWTCFLERR